MTTLRYTGELTLLTCWCGMRHAVPEELRNHQLRQRANGEQVDSVFCPLGHAHAPSGEGKAARLERELAEAERRVQAERDLRQDTERRLTAQRGETTKAKKRAAAAVCPCCNRSFVQLRRHMANKHPDYDPTLASPRTK